MNTQNFEQIGCIGVEWQHPPLQHRKPQIRQFQSFGGTLATLRAYHCAGLKFSSIFFSSIFIAHLRFK